MLYALEISMPVMTIDELLEGSGIKEVRDIKQNKQTKKKLTGRLLKERITTTNMLVLHANVLRSLLY